MQKNKKYMIYFGIFINLIFAIALVASAIDYYRGWDTIKKFNLDNWLKTDEAFLHAANYQFFPAAAAVMVISAFLFWRLRK